MKKLLIFGFIASLTFCSGCFYEQRQLQLEQMRLQQQQRQIQIRQQDQMLDRQRQQEKIMDKTGQILDERLKQLKKDSATQD